MKSFAVAGRCDASEAVVVRLGESSAYPDIVFKFLPDFGDFRIFTHRCIKLAGVDDRVQGKNAG